MALRQGNLVDTTPFQASKTTVLKGGAFVGGVSTSTVVEQVVLYVLNRGRNTGAGDAYVYWLSPETVDSSGTHYPAGKPDWANITDVIGVGYRKTILP